MPRPYVDLTSVRGTSPGAGPSSGADLKPDGASSSPRVCVCVLVRVCVHVCVHLCDLHIYRGGSHRPHRQPQRVLAPSLVHQRWERLCAERWVVLGPCHLRCWASLLGLAPPPAPQGALSGAQDDGCVLALLPGDLTCVVWGCIPARFPLFCGTCWGNLWFSAGLFLLRFSVDRWLEPRVLISGLSSLCWDLSALIPLLLEEKEKGQW